MNPVNVALTHLQHPRSHDPPHARRYLPLDTFKVVRSGEVLLLYPQQSVQDPVGQQVGVPVGSGNSRPVPLTAPQLRLHSSPSRYRCRPSRVTAATN